VAYARNVPRLAGSISRIEYNPASGAISVQPDGDSWKVKVVQEGSVDDADRREMVEQIDARLKGEYDLKG
jgi:hypothetical protein